MCNDVIQVEGVNVIKNVLTLNQCLVPHLKHQRRVKYRIRYPYMYSVIERIAMLCNMPNVHLTYPDSPCETVTRNIISILNVYVSCRL